MTVYENIAFGLQVQKMDKEEIRKKVVEMGKKVDLNEEQLKKKVSELSGGQQQRVAIAVRWSPTLRSSAWTSLCLTLTQSCAFSCATS